MAVKINGGNGLLQAYDYQTPTTGFSYTFTTGNNVLLLNPAAALASGTLTMPASPSDGMTITVTSTKAIAALTWNANTGQTISTAPTTLGANAPISYIYRLASTTWIPYSPLTSGALPTVSLITSTSTYTVPAGVSKIKVTVIGGGGGGASSGGACSGRIYGGSGGGAGGAAIKTISGLVSGASISVTIGAGGAAGASGGTTSFGAYCSATGGASPGGTNYGGAGGVGSSGDINIGGGGGSGGGGLGASGGTAWTGSGAGGSSFMGGGGAAGSGNGGDGQSYGGGGGGALSGTGGTGGSGVVIVEY